MNSLPQGEIIAMALLVAFLIFITARGELGTYIRLLV
jgi:hypothetical protein